MTDLTARIKVVLDGVADAKRQIDDLVDSAGAMDDAADPLRRTFDTIKAAANGLTDAAKGLGQAFNSVSADARSAAASFGQNVDAARDARTQYGEVESALTKLVTAYRTFRQAQAQGIDIQNPIADLGSGELDQYNAWIKQSKTNPFADISNLANNNSALAQMRAAQQQEAAYAKIRVDEGQLAEIEARRVTLSGQLTAATLNLAKAQKNGDVDAQLEQQQKLLDIAPKLNALTQQRNDLEDQYRQRIAAANQAIDDSAEEQQLKRDIDEYGEARAAAMNYLKAKEQLAKAEGVNSWAEGNGNLEQQAVAAENFSKAELNMNAAAERLRTSTGGLSERELPRLRYAMYDVSFAMGLTGAAFLGAGVAAEKVASDYQAAWANVARTFSGTQDQLDGIRQGIVGITQEMPSSFDDLSKIATLGNQMNIDPSSLINFTKATAEFAQVTDTSVDTAATDFGRLGQLLHDADFAHIGDEIAYLGVSAIATEPQIASVAQQIAVTTKAAGFGTDQTLALATALASLGVAPEAARGSMLRVFAQINSAIASGGDSLNSFAKTAGMSADDFKKAWASDASGTFTNFISGLGTNVPVADATLKSLGITAARDRQSIELLAQNTDVLTDAQKNAANAAGYLNQAMQFKNNTVAGQFTILANSVKNLFDTLGGGDQNALVDFLKGLNSFLAVINKIAQNPFLRDATEWSVIIAALSGVVLLGAAAFLRFAGTLAAVRTAASEAATGLGSALMGVLSEALAIITGRAFQAKAALDDLTVSEIAAGNASKAAGTAMTGAAGAAGKFGSALKLISLATFIPLINSGTNAITSWTEKMRLAAEANGDFARSMSQDQFNKALQPNLGWAKFIDDFGGDLGDTAVQKYGKNPTKYNDAANGSFAGADKVLSGTGVVDFATSVQALDKSMADLVKKGNIQQANQLFKQFQTFLKQHGGDAKDAAKELTQYEQALKGVNTSTNDAVAAQQNQASSAEDSADAFKDLIDAVYGTSIAAQQVGADLNNLGQSMIQNGSDAALSGADMTSVLNDIFSLSGGDAQTAANMMQGFFNALISGGYASASQLAMLQSVIADLISQVGPNATATPTTFSLRPLSDGMDTATTAAHKLGSAASSAAKQVKTLVDYGNDLSGVLERANDIRFGNQDAEDKISSAWADIANNASDAASAIDDANQKMREANATLEQLASDKQIDEYWLKVAQMYGDTARASEIQADLAKNASDTASAQNDRSSAQSDLAKAQDQASTSLTGNSSQDIANRSAITGLVSNYNDLIKSMASSGMSQGDLAKQVALLQGQFMTQGQSLGFDAGQLGTYAASFSDMAKIVAQVPRNVNVPSSSDPALQAINEFLAQQATNAGGADGGGGGLVTAGKKDGSDAWPQPGPAGPATIKINGDTKPVGQALNDIITVINNMAPKLTIDGKKEPAVAALRDVEKAIDDGRGYVEINGHQEKAQTVLDNILGTIDSSVGKINIDGVDRPASTVLDQLMKTVNSTSGTVDIDGNKIPAADALNAVIDAIDNGDGTVTINGQKEQATDVLKDLINQVNTSPAALHINATYDKNAASSIGDLWAADMRSGIVSYFNQNPIWAYLGSDPNGSDATYRVQGSKTVFKAKGGLVSGPGTGTSDSIDARLSNGEWVFPERAVSNVGVAGMAMLQDLAMSGRLFQPSAAPSGGTTIIATPNKVQLVELSPYDRQLLADIRDSSGVSIDPNGLSQTVSALNSNSAQRGRN